MVCFVMQNSVIKYMLAWIPIKYDLLYYKLDPGIDFDTITFRLIWFTVSEFVGFMGLF